MPNQHPKPAPATDDELLQIEADVTTGHRDELRAVYEHGVAYGLAVQATSTTTDGGDDFGLYPGY
jgi:hypothetical protein